MTILVVAESGRALAAAARRAGEKVVIADFFGDLDTRSFGRWVPLPGSLATGIDPDGCLEMLRRLGEEIDGCVYGAGFEAHPALLDEMSRATPLLGNSAASVAAVKDERRLAALLDRLGIPHPRIAAVPPSGSGWLRKKRGAAGGIHVRPADVAAQEGGDYFQERASGRPVSALFIADGLSARVIGFSVQWTAPSEAAPFRYGGCAGPAPVPPRFERSISDACAAIVALVGLVGVNSLDMLVDGDAFTVLEINPRPGATLDIFDVPPHPPLWRCHRDGVAGRLPAVEKFAARQAAHAAMVVYAPRKLRVPERARWPDWTADRPAPGTIIDADDPVCTVRSEGETVEAARAAAEARGAVILRALTPVPAELPETA